MAQTATHAPSFDLLLRNYPDDDDPEAVKQQIGGHVNAAWITNTCAVRLSRALNYSGFPLPGNFAGMQVVSGADKKYYAYRMQELKRWLAFRLGPPTLEVKKPGTGSVDRANFAGKRGIIVFDIHFSDASGHIDLWDGQTFTHEHVAGKDYFALATTVALWELP